MKKSKKCTNRQFILLSCFLLFLFGIGTKAQSEEYESRRIKETKYVDNYFEVDDQGDYKLHVFLGQQKIATIDNDNGAIYPISDHLASPTIITDKQGEVVETNDYQSYGQINYQNGSSDSNYKFIGKELDNETNLQYFGQRYYDNSIGKFISIDPIAINSVSDYLADPQQLNSYAYAKSNPLRFLDPDGNKNIEFQPYYSRNGYYDFGKDYGNYRGVNVISAGVNSGEDNHPYQCVGLFQNFTEKQYGVRIGGLGKAVNYGKQDLLNKFNGVYSGDFKVYQNEGSVMPQENDIITWSHPNGIGHIGVITEVVFDDKSGEGYVYSLEQNYSGYQALYSQGFTRGYGDQGQVIYTVDSRGKYTVQGWTRYENQSLMSGMGSNYTNIQHTPATQNHIYYNE